MRDETFFLDGKCALHCGIRLQRPISVSGAEPIIESVHVAGRNGDLIYDTGAYSNRTATAECFALSHLDVFRYLSEATRFLLSKPGYRRLETSDDIDHFWIARVKNGAQVEQRLRTAAPFTIEFDCKPQKYARAGERPVTFSSNSTLYNPYGFHAKPIIIVDGAGAGDMTINGTTIEVLTLDGRMFIDTDTENAYNGNVLLNSSIHAAHFPVLGDGANEIAFTGGINKVTIIPRWWEL